MLAAAAAGWLAAAPARGQVPLGDGSAVGEASDLDPSAAAPYCRSGPSWLDVDGRVGTVRLSRDGRRALVGYVHGEGTALEGRTRLRVVDLATRRPVVTADLGSFGQVTDIWPSHEGRRVWVAAERGGRLLTVDSRNGELLMMWEIGETSPQSGAVSSGDLYLYVTNRVAGTLTLINRATAGARTLELGAGVSGVAVWERGPRTVWIANQASDELVAVSGWTGEVLTRMESGGRGPAHLRIRPGTDELWVAHVRSRDVVVVDARERRVLDRIPLRARPDDLLFSSDGAVAYVSVAGRDRVLRIDAGSRGVTESVSPTGARPGLVVAGCAAGLRRGCPGRTGTPWMDPSGLPVSWVDDQRIVEDRLCGSSVWGTGDRDGP